MRAQSAYRRVCALRLSCLFALVVSVRSLFRGARRPAGNELRAAGMKKPGSPKRGPGTNINYPKTGLCNHSLFVIAYSLLFSVESTVTVPVALIAARSGIVITATAVACLSVCRSPPLFSHVSARLQGQSSARRRRMLRCRPCIQASIRTSGLRHSACRYPYRAS